ncbi:2-keto-4-pentenoate hydratase/2-oxohepta-3-ene-1,7-dioic acid hydratase in catechol pathway [Pullulanibacillus pueri]|uniref:Fumarylacetoacetase-like C-terminal domain-containing protein n=1 Tax=Pullulanibacillus pueri TaxID=1437324 RepID=A0A8J2ZVE5_9BACL|nr:fumarylacetoacetate hydrolase family protein [Pullulanibacillus pueri]MBM7680914.1 2-keto-4-pentenoate hydratase/2-oxohepta-3-ene-1,7-dioic acid hydratase in catechol pathway [Pullulanibacillus pueri]GGH81314.1 hypothetical protein GCM10007096_19030 [Pullulanibacillus pueri]
MKLVTVVYQDQSFVGALVDNYVINLNQVMDSPELTMLGLIQGGKALLQSAKDKVERADINVSGYPVGEVTIKAPLSDPGKVVCVGNNYMDHCREQNVTPPEKPLIFSKWPSCIVGPDDEIILPNESEQVDFEAELAVVFGKEGKNILEDEVFDHIFGYMIVNDISARDVQFSDGQWVRGKSFDTFLPTGPYIVTADEIDNPHDLSIRLTVNGEALQDSNTKEMIFDITDQITYLSKGFTFKPGDILATGTPHGVGVFRKPPIFLKDGDEVSISIAGLGSLSNRCVSESSSL